MEKKIYEKPAMQMELFVPNHYASACANPKEWEATCRKNGSRMIFYGGGDAGPDDWTSDAYRGGCGRTHHFTWEGDNAPGANCWILTTVTLDGRGHINNLSDSEIREYFTGTATYDSDTHWHGLTLTDAGVRHFTNNGLVKGFYYRLDQGNWLVTDDLIHIHPAS